MGRRLIPTKLYKDTVKLFRSKGFIIEAPPLRWTVEDCYGYLKYSWYKKKGRGKRIYCDQIIYLNKAYAPCYKTDVVTEGGRKRFSDLIDTIAHELAHLSYKNHSDKHENLTQKYRSEILENIIVPAGGILEYCQDCKL